MDTEKPDMLVGIDFGMTYTGRMLFNHIFAEEAATRHTHISLRCRILETTDAGTSCANKMAWKNVAGDRQSTYYYRV